MTYQPGTHILASFKTHSTQLLDDFNPVKILLKELIVEFRLQQLGEVYHAFPGGGYTALVCLSESHISLHSWPEYQLVNLDIYLSNFRRNNDGTVKAIYDKLLDFFQAIPENVQILTR